MHYVRLSPYPFAALVLLCTDVKVEESFWDSVVSSNRVRLKTWGTYLSNTTTKTLIINTNWAILREMESNRGIIPVEVGMRQCSTFGHGARLHSIHEISLTRNRGHQIAESRRWNSILKTSYAFLYIAYCMCSSSSPIDSQAYIFCRPEVCFRLPQDKRFRQSLISRKWGPEKSVSSYLVERFSLNDTRQKAWKHCSSKVSYF